MKTWYEDGQLQEEAIVELAIVLHRRKWDHSGNLVEMFDLVKEDPMYQTLLKHREIFK